MLSAALGHSNDPETEFAIAEVLEQCVQELNGTQPQAGMLLAGIDLDHALILQQIAQTFPNLALIGATTDGEISSLMGFQQNSLVLMLFCTDATVEITAGVGHHLSQHPTVATQQAVDQALAQSTLPPQLCLTLPEGLLANGVAAVTGLHQALKASVPVVGGTAADRGGFKATYQFFGTQVYQDAVPILLFSGNLQFSIGVASGKSPIGQSGRVTRSEGNVLYEVDAKPVFEFFQNYVGDVQTSYNYPLAVFEKQDSNFYIRNLCALDEAAGSITFFGDIPEQAIVQMTEGSREDILHSCKISIQHALDTYPGQTPTDRPLLFLRWAAANPGNSRQSRIRTAAIVSFGVHFRLRLLYLWRDFSLYPGGYTPVS